MKYLIYALLFVATVSDLTVAKPQNVQIEKQVVFKVPAEEINSSLEQLPILVADENPERKAKEILDKIGEVNQELTKNNILENIYNPATNYLNAQRLDFNPSFKNNIDDSDKIEGFDDKIPDGQTIKRKIFHKVSYLVPNPLIRDSIYNLQQLQNLPQLGNYQTIQDDSITTYPYDTINQNYNQLPQQRPYSASNFNTPTTRVDQWPWPFAQFFPVLIKDPFLSVLNGFSGIIEYGPAANICAKDENKPKTTKKNASIKNNATNRRGKAIDIDTNLTSKQIIDTDLKLKQNKTDQNSTARHSKYNSTDESKIFNLFLKPQMHQRVPEINDSSDDDSKIFGPLSNIPHQITNPGFFINRLRVRKGGVAIAGPGGVATAGGGGTAIVGPGGVAYTKPNGMAIVGPGAKIVSLPEELDLTKLIEDLSRPHHSVEFADEGRKIDGEYVLKNDGSSLKKIFIPTGGKIVATGPMIYHNPA